MLGPTFCINPVVAAYNLSSSLKHLTAVPMPPHQKASSYRTLFKQALVLALVVVGLWSCAITVPHIDPPRHRALTTTRVDLDDPTVFPHMLVDRLSLEQFKNNIRILSDFGDRTQGSSSYNRAANWLVNQLQSVGYVVERASYTYGGRARNSIYVTKVGTVFPDRMYIVSAHLDGRGGGGGANDDGSGVSLVLEIARILAGRDVTCATSIRMIFWNNEETGLNGSRAYAASRKQLQGKESPSGSGKYPEPRWLGIIQHDQILYDHGLPPQAEQIANADADIEYLATSAYSSQSLQLANYLKAGNVEYAKYYPAEVSGEMSSTDSMPFADLAPAVSVRENRRLAEIGRGSQPNWHKSTDRYATYGEKDFLFGLNIVQTTLGTVAQLAQVKV